MMTFRQKKATTLIELLISLAIIALLAAVALPLFSVYQRRNQISSDAETINSSLILARATLNNPNIIARSNNIIKIVFSYNSSTKSYSYKIFVKDDVDPENLIDDFRLFANEDITVTMKDSGGDTTFSNRNFAILLSEKTPNENFKCYQITSRESRINCNQSISIKLSSPRIGGTEKTIVINNTTSSQLFSININ
ncbi:MAG: hypothetical protein Athens101428_323 [Candidatus Berkelbacteria bacterium Athens1014_28]|uniref:Prepilin-type N-terminal cleavage/methylation domain-containing protein n=1 Tax=Candidatus Berkelbacteria bacterium Athens1014_28 TaxID=2017145 RepID=A0A554LNA2_9BACT|nr:MAG: hypothetical protein Athens101428_323 [Candidatus Berkelbacteria bacterium Athens1014_28]